MYNKSAWHNIPWEIHHTDRLVYLQFLQFERGSNLIYLLLQLNSHWTMCLKFFCKFSFSSSLESIGIYRNIPICLPLLSFSVLKFSSAFRPKKVLKSLEASLIFPLSFSTGAQVWCFHFSASVSSISHLASLLTHPSLHAPSSLVTSQENHPKKHLQGCLPSLHQEVPHSVCVKFNNLSLLASCPTGREFRLKNRDETPLKVKPALKSDSTNQTGVSNSM